MKKTTKLGLKRTTITALTPAQLAAKAGGTGVDSLACDGGTWYSCDCQTWGQTCFSCDDACWQTAQCF